MLEIAKETIYFVLSAVLGVLIINLNKWAIGKLGIPTEDKRKSIVYLLTAFLISVGIGIATGQVVYGYVSITFACIASAMAAGNGFDIYERVSVIFQNTFMEVLQGYANKFTTKITEGDKK